MNIPDISSLKKLDKRLALIPLGGVVLYMVTRPSLTPEQNLEAYRAETRRQTELARITKQPELESIRSTAKVALDASKRKESTDIALANAQNKTVTELSKTEATSQKYAIDAQKSISSLMYATQTHAINTEYLMGKYKVDKGSDLTKYQTDREYWLREHELKNQKSKNDDDFWGGLIGNIGSFFF